MAKRVVLVKHEGSPRDDRAAIWLARQGFELHWRSPYAGDGLEVPDDSVAGTVLYGGPQGIPEIDRHPFLAEEARWVERCLRRDIPVLGLCLGGQIVAHALGAAVGPGPDGLHEFGYYELFPTDAGRAVIPEGLVVTQAHFHEFAVPEGAELLAKSELYRHQAFRYDGNAFAFQFHPEITGEGFRRWQDADWAPWGEPGVQTREEQDTHAAPHDQAQHDWFVGFLEQLFGRPDGER
ncbi:MAG: glutamine amidotransferase [Rhodospirillales bacterium]|nr:glutamine amidotransferase [Rhodospirillales bacterium]